MSKRLLLLSKIFRKIVIQNKEIVSEQVDMRFIERQGSGKKDVYYVLTAVYRQLIGI